MSELSLTGHDLGRYRVLSLLGRGGMGAVYRALDTSLDRQVALKVLPPELTGDPQRLDRFIREAKTASSLNHPHLVSVYEVGEQSIDGQPVRFIAMELVEGETLRERTGKPMEIRRALQIMSQVADAVAAAHGAGITHRDLKPENILLSNAGYVKVVDFGLAKLATPEGGDDAKTAVRGTDPGVVMGTVGYMSPEQAQGREADARSDVFALGCVLYELVTGRRAFLGDSSVETLHRIISTPPDSLAVHRADAPLEMQRIVSKSLAKDPEDRYQSVKDLAVDLRHLLREIDSNPDLVTVSSGRHAAVAPPRGRMLPWIVAGGILALVAVAAIVFMLRRADEEPSPAALRVARVTSLGKVIAVAISPDAKLIAYVTSDQGQQSLWLRQIASGRDLQLLPPDGVAYWSHTFAPDGNSIVFGVKSDRDPRGAFYQISTLGGTPEFLIAGIDSPPSYSPDGKRMTWVAEHRESASSALMVANADGSGAKKVASRKRPVVFAPVFYTGPSWSPDGRLIAVAENRREGGVEARLIGVEPETGRERVLSTGWRVLAQVAWLPEGDGLLGVGARDAADTSAGSGGPANTQIWRIPMEGEPSRVTNDLFDYRIVNLSADGKTLVSVATDVQSAIWRAPLDGSGDPERLTRERLDGIYGMSQLPDGDLLYVSLHGGTLRIVRGKGGNTPPAEVNRGEDSARYSVASADGRSFVYLAFTSDGTELRRALLDRPGQERVLAKGIEGNPIAMTPDGRWAIFSDDGALWRVSTAGGAPIRYAIPGLAAIPAVSPDGKRVAFYWYQEDVGPSIGIVPLEGGAVSWSHPAEPTHSGTALGWMVDGSGLVINTVARERSNLWLLPFNGEMKKLTSFQDQTVGSFEVARDGKSVVFTRYELSRDAVMINNFR